LTDYTYQDYDGRQIVLGTKVVCMDATVGTVMQIDEIDCDYDDELGRAVGYGPYVYVQWPDSPGLNQFRGYPQSNGWADYPDGPSTYIFEDLEVVA
jgi:hypothetical protein